MKQKIQTVYILFRKENYLNRYMFLGDFDKLKDAKECAILNSVEKDDSYILKRTTTIRERKIRVIKR